MKVITWLGENFTLVQGFLLGAVVVMAYRGLQKRAESSQFRTREFEKPNSNESKRSAIQPPPFQKKPSPEPLALPGIQLDGEAHEVLGVAPDASVQEVLKAYKEAIRRYHPDLSRGATPEQIQQATEISMLINAAKDALLRGKKL